MTTPVIDVHTHVLTEGWFRLLEEHGGPRYTVREVPGGLRAIHLDGAPFMTPVPPMFDYATRLAEMDRNGVDVAVVSLTCPNVYWGGPEVSLEAARIMNADMERARTAYRGRIEWFCSLPWQYPEQALPELERCVQAGAKGVMVLANITGEHLTAPKFAPLWEAIDRHALPVLVHPTAPPGVADMQMNEFQLTASIGFTFDTTLALARMIYDGFFDRYRKLKIIGAHAGGALPFLIARMDQCWRHIPAARARTQIEPQEYLHRIYCDCVVFSPEALDLTIKVFGADNVLYGSDYPHTIGDMPGTVLRMNQLPRVTRDKVRGLNARRIFGL
jgi:aminocarboxymuconate-semialdehyde decarboxylase